MSTAIHRGRRGAGAALGVAAFGVAVVVLVAGCSGGPKNTGAKGTASSMSSAAAASTSAAAPANFEQYLACLRQHGVNVPSASARPSSSGSRRPRPSGSFSRPPGGFRGGFGGGFLGSATADPSVQAAMQACASLRPSGGFGPGGQRTISATTFAAFKSCMGDNGVTISQSDPQTALRLLNRDDAKTAAALKTCQVILGSRQPSQSAAASLG